MTWRRIGITGFGGPDRLEMQTDETVPESKGTEVRIRVLVTSAAFTDVMIRKGLYRDVKEKPPLLPATIWSESWTRRAVTPPAFAQVTAWRTSRPSAPMPSTSTCPRTA